MERRLPLALFLSFLVLFGWTLLNPPVEEKGASAGDAGRSAAPAPRAPPSIIAADEPGLQPDVAASELVEDTLLVGQPGVQGYFEAGFSNRGARLTTLRCGSFFVREGLDEAQREDRANWLTLLAPVDTDAGQLGSLLLRTSRSSQDLAPSDRGGLDEALWVYERLPDGRGVRFTYGPGTGVVFTKEISFEPESWRLHVRLSIENRAAGGERPCEFLLIPAGCLLPELGDSFYPEPRAISVGGPDAEEIAWESAVGAKSPGTLDVPAPVAFVGNHNKYFAFFLRGATAADVATIGGASYAPVVERSAEPGVKPTPLIVTRVPLGLRLPAEGATNSYDYVIYAGPKDRDTLAHDFPPHAKVLDEDLSSWFDTIAWIGHGLLVVLRFFHGLTGNWGVAIILLTICVRAALFPLNRRTQTSMARYQKKMKRVQPKLEEVKKRFADDPQKLREAQARIMQEEGAFPPLGGCLPIFLQFPVFIGLFSALRTSFDLRQAPFFGWMTDLSRPDRLLELGLQVPLLITTLDLRYLNVLPLIMIGLMIVQQRGMPKPTDEQAARMQKMMMVMPFMFAFFLYSYAAGLSLYVITSSTIGILETKVIKKLWPIDDTEPVKKKASGCGPFSGIMQNLAEKQKAQMRLMEERRRTQQATAKKQQRRRRR